MFYVHRTQAPTTACWSSVVLRPQNTGPNDRLLVERCFTSTEHRPQRPPVGRALFYVHRTQATTTACWSSVVLRPQNTGHNDRLLVECCFTSTEHRPQRPPVGRALFYVHRTQAPTTACWSSVVLRPQNTGHNDRLLVERCFTSTEHRPQRPPVGRLLFYVHRTQATTTACWSSVVLRPQNTGPNDRLLVDCCFTSTETVGLFPGRPPRLSHRPQRPPVGRALFYVHRTQATTTACWSSVVLRPQNTGHNDRLLVERCFTSTEHRPQRPPVGRVLFHVHRTQAPTTACWSSVVLRPQNTGPNDRLLVERCFTSTEHRPQRPPVGRLLFYVHRTQATTTACWSSVVLRPQNTGPNDRLLVDCCFTSTETVGLFPGRPPRLSHRPQPPPVGRALFYVHRTQATTTACWSSVDLRPQNTGHNDRLLVERCFTSTEHRPQRPPVGRVLFHVHRTQAPTTACWSSVVLRPQNTGPNDRLLVERCFTSTEHRPQRPPVGRALFYVHRTQATTTACWSTVVLRPQNTGHNDRLLVERCFTSTEHRPQRPPVGRVLFYVHRNRRLIPRTATSTFTQAPTTACWSSVVLRPQNTGHNDRLLVERCFTSTEHRPQRPPVGRLLFYVHRNRRLIPRRATSTFTQAPTTACWSSVVLRPQNTGHNDRLLVERCFTSTEHRPQRPPVGRALFYVHRNRRLIPRTATSTFTQAPTTACWSSVVLRPQNTGHNDRLLVERCFTSTEHRPQRPPVGRALFYVHRNRRLIPRTATSTFTQAPTTACWSSVVLRPQNTGHNDRLLVERCFTSTEHRPQRPPVGRALFYVHRNRRLIPRTATSTFTQAPTTACWSSVVLRPQNTGHNDRLLVERCFTSTEHRPQRPPVGRALFYVHRNRRLIPRTATSTFTQAPTTACWSSVVLRPQNTGHNDRLLVDCCFTSTEHRPQRPPVGRGLFYVHRNRRLIPRTATSTFTQAPTTACWSSVVLRPQNTGHNDRLLVDCCFTSTEHRPQRPPVGRALFYVHRNRRLIPRTATSTFTQAPTTACWSSVVLRPQNTGHNDRLLVDCCFTSTEHRPQRPPVGRALFYVHRNRRLIPRTATSTFTQLLSSGLWHFPFGFTE